VTPVNDAPQAQDDTITARLARSTLPWLAVNVSPHQLKTAAFVDHVARTLEHANVTASRLHLELPLKALL
jgi:EAL domain-containing protein (putative c-di-GMP-specific phosphodiesterase class I)|tara:strand:- start:495 stop:704 length:210 start_codon:yes stop_codon:yes gene_type:complete